jgi:hypothetical protein
MAGARDDDHPEDPAARTNETTSSVVAAWADHDAARALHPDDRSAIRATEAARSLVIDLLGATAPKRDLFNACARLGGLMAESGASPSLAAGTVDGAVRALSDAGVPFDATRIAAARASLVEGYVAGVRDAEYAASLSSWEYPACSVPLEDGTVAIACGHPTDDGEALAGWAARIAGRLVKAKVRRVVLSGSDAAKAEVASAVELVGIEVATGARLDSSSDARPRTSETKSWLRLLWRR